MHENTLDICAHPSRVSLQLPHSSLSPGAFWEWAESSVLEGARRLQHLCRMLEDKLNAPDAQVSVQIGFHSFIQQQTTSGRFTL